MPNGYTPPIITDSTELIARIRQQIKTADLFAKDILNGCNAYDSATSIRSDLGFALDLIEAAKDRPMTYYLVQRLESKATPFPKDVGFDQFFSLEYMGSSEFEWGAIPKALQNIRTHKVVSQGIEVTLDGLGTRTVYFVGDKSALKQAAADMETWSKKGERYPSFWGKEHSYFPDAFANIPDKYRTTDAWWALEEDVAWALDPAVADQLVTAFNSKPKKAN